MGGRGGGTANGGGGGTTRAKSGGATTNLSQMQALAQKSGTAADKQLADAIIKTYTGVAINSNEQDTDTQRFFNAIGWTARKPTVVSSEAALQQERKAGRTMGDYMYHTDATYGPVTDAKVFADQYMGNGRQFMSAGIYGDGTYFSNKPGNANSWGGSWGYGRTPKSYQFKGVLKNDGSVKMIDAGRLDSMIRTFKRTHPNAASAIESMTRGKGGGQKGVYAVLFGYNTIKNGWGGGEFYYTVLDRSTTIVAKQGIYRTDAQKARYGHGWRHVK